MNNTGGDEDDSDPAVVPLAGPSIMIIKTDNNTADSDGGANDTQTIEAGANAVFEITITNNGDMDLDTLVVTDTLAPNCGGIITLPNTFPSTWTNPVVGGQGDNTDAVFQVNETITYTCSDINVTADYTNTISVSAQSVDNDEPVNNSDTSLVDVVTRPSPPSSSGNSGGGTNPVCQEISRSGNQVTCTGNG